MSHLVEVNMDWFDDNEVRDECTRRGLTVPGDPETAAQFYGSLAADWLDQLADAFARGDPRHFRLLLERGERELCAKMNRLLPCGEFVRPPDWTAWRAGQ